MRFVDRVPPRRNQTNEQSADHGRTIQSGVLQSGRIFYGFQVSEKMNAWNEPAYFFIQFFEDLVPLLYRPLAGNQNVHGDEFTAAGLSSPESVIANLPIDVAFERLFHLGQVRILQSRIHQAQR